MNDEKRPTMLLPRQAAEEFGIPVYRVRKWVAEGRIVSVPCGRKNLINREKFLAFLNGELESEKDAVSLER